MSKVQHKLNELQLEIDTLNSELSRRIEVTSNLRKEVEQAIELKNNQHYESNNQIDKFEKEISSLTINVQAERSAIELLRKEIDQLNPKLQENKSTISTFTKDISDSEAKLGDLTVKVNAKTLQKDKLISEKNINSSSLTATLNEIDTKVSSNIETRDKAEKDFNQVKKKNAIWDFLYEKMDNPDIEIISIIATNRESSLEVIKRKTEVSPVFISRSLSKLEADGKIVQTEEGLWDLSSVLISAIGN